MKRIYVIWGGVIGWDGVVTSAGLVTMQNQLRVYGPVKSYLQQGSYQCANEIYSECAKDDIPVLIGYSGGSVMATRICNDPLLRRKQDISLLINIDGSPAGNIQAVLGNVKKIVNIYDPHPWIFGGGVVRGINPARDYPMDLAHLAFQTSSEVRSIVMKEVAAL